MEQRFKAWGLPVCLFMVAYGVAGVWLSYNPKWLANSLTAMVLPVIVGMIGLVYLVGEVSRQPDQPSTNPLGGLLGIYVGAWHNFWQTPWILKVYACIALVSTISAVQGVTSVLIVRRLFPSTIGQSPFPLGLFEAASSAFSSAQSSSLSAVIPHIGLNFSGAEGFVCAVIVLISSFWIDKRLAILARTPENSRGVAFARVLVYPVAVFSAIFVVVWSVEFYRLWVQVSRGDMPPRGIQWGTVISDAFSAVVSSALIAGIVGGLRRIKNGDAGLGGFFTDAMCYFGPMLGIYLVCALAGVIPQLAGQWLSAAPRSETLSLSPFYWAAWAYRIILTYSLILVAFAPFEAVVHESGIWQAMKNSARLWSRNLGLTVSFVALGCAMITLPRMAFLVAYSFAGKTSWFVVPIGALTGVVWVMCHALMILALWEFYAREVVSGSEAGSTVQAKVG